MHAIADLRCLCNCAVFEFVGQCCPNNGDDGRSSATKAPREMLVAQAWWDASTLQPINRRNR